MHRSRAPYMCGLFKTVYNYCEIGYSFGYDLVFGSAKRLHCTWLVPCTRASSDGVDDLDSGEWIHLKRGVDRRGCGPIGLRGYRVMLCGGLRPPSEESGGTRHRATFAFFLAIFLTRKIGDCMIYKERNLLYQEM
ncbi:hypothetical protein M9H77_27401 [Catharanthus roseus]|uniref:Uncharacterized protein n=1 Tax=Catharanthus roseus TaxID=4058 RepID=A0ACC0AF55_CATRO|nr:hypothetical protein M9H77_27401 [Catharanthus roseus]